MHKDLQLGKFSTTGGSNVARVRAMKNNKTIWVGSQEIKKEGFDSMPPMKSKFKDELAPLKG